MIHYPTDPHKWAWFKTIYMMGTIQSKNVNDVLWYNLAHVCEQLSYQSGSYRVIFKRLPGAYKCKMNMELQGKRRIIRCAVNKLGVSHILYTMREKRKKVKANTDLVDEQQYKKKMYTQMRKGW